MTHAGLIERCGLLFPGAVWLWARAERRVRAVCRCPCCRGVREPSPQRVRSAVWRGPVRVRVRGLRAEPFVLHKIVASVCAKLGLRCGAVERERRETFGTLKSRKRATYLERKKPRRGRDHSSSASRRRGRPRRASRRPAHRPPCTVGGAAQHLVCPFNMRFIHRTERYFPHIIRHVCVHHMCLSPCRLAPRPQPRRRPSEPSSSFARQSRTRTDSTARTLSSAKRPRRFSRPRRKHRSTCSHRSAL